MTQRLSVVVPVYCNETTLMELGDRLIRSLETIADTDFEVIFIDDASTDGSWFVIETLAKADPRVVGLRLGSNAGQLRATCAGFDIVGGEILVSIDADLEHPPEAIPQLVDAFRDGHDLVVTKRIGQASERIRVFGSFAVNLVARILRVPLSDIGSSFLVCTPRIAGEMRRVVDQTGRQMLLPTVYGSAFNPTVIEVELSAKSTSAYALPRVVRLAGEFAAAELGPAAGRLLLLASGSILPLAVHAPWRRSVTHFSASATGLGLIGILAPFAFRRDRSEPLYRVAARVGDGLSPRSES